MNFTIINTIDDSLLDSFYNDSSLTLEGLDPNSIKDYAEYLDKVCGLKDGAIFFVISGAYMNAYYNLYGDNAYPDNLNIVVIRLNNLNNPSAIVTKRFEFGGRWFDDVVDNNAGLHSKSCLG